MSPKGKVYGEHMGIIESPFMPIIADLAKNNTNLTPALQDAIAKYLDYQSTPVIKIDTNKLKAGLAKSMPHGATLYNA